VLVLQGIDLPVGLIVDEVYGFRRFLDSERSDKVPRTIIRCEQYLDGSFDRGVEVWPVFDIDRLRASAEFQQAAE